MGATDYMLQSMNFLHEAFRVATDGLSDEQLHHSAEGESHSIAWVLWHVARIEDLFVQRVFQEKPEEWASGGWAAKTGLPEKGFGTNQPAAEAKALHVGDMAALRQYALAVAKRTDEFLTNADDRVLDREVTLGERKETIGQAITLHFITHMNGHRGEINQLRGEMGYQPVLPGRGG
ncbi:MAG TPA: DinB family protein [Dehalococcoidia bacterium]|nr:DinB family protein [Dehalococcoidia bacterium]